MTTLVGVIFVATYALIAARRLRWLPIGRPAGALLGAVAMLVVGAITPAEAYASIDHDTILLLLAMMMLTAYLERASFFDVLAHAVLRRARSPWHLLVVVALASGFLSALLVNDTVCVFLTPVVLTLCRRARLPYLPFLLAVATSANIGSAATLVGNPQNMLIAGQSHVPFVTFLRLCGPSALAGLVVNIGLLRLFYARTLPAELPAHDGPAPQSGPALWRAGLALAGIVVAFFAGSHLALAAMTGVVLLMVAERSDPAPFFARVEWSVLVFFGALFVVVGAVAKHGFVDHAWAVCAPAMTSSVTAATAFLVAASNIVSNVPLVLLIGHKAAALHDGAVGWALLGYVTTVAGNLTLIGSVANIIVAELARDECPIGFVEYAKFGVVSTVVVILVGVPLLLALG